MPHPLPNESDQTRISLSWFVENEIQFVPRPDKMLETRVANFEPQLRKTTARDFVEVQHRPAG